MAITEIKEIAAPTYKQPDAFSYDPMQDASYQALARVYTNRGNKAAQSTMADAAMLNGGYGTSYATSAAQQARNDYNMELASQIPQLEANAYNRYRDSIADKQWQYANDYQRYMDAKNYNLDVYQTKKANASGGGGGRSGGGGGGLVGMTTGNNFLPPVIDEAEDLEGLRKFEPAAKAAVEVLGNKYNPIGKKK